MKFIRKTSEPSSLAAWKLQNPDMNWDDFKSRQTCHELRDTLLEEQGYICCYCEREIRKDNGHFEHLLPRSYQENGVKIGRQKELDYENLVFSCTKYNRPTNEEDEITTCGHEKENWYDADLFVSPLHEDCESQFRYQNDGTIAPVNGSEKAQETIDRLKLNGEPLNDELVSKLVLKRKAVMEEVWKTWSECEENPDVLLRIAESELNRDANGKFRPFWTTMRQVFEEILGQSWTCPE